LHKNFLNPQIGTNFVVAVDKNNTFERWIQFIILLEKDLNERTKILTIFIELAYELLKMGNFASSLPIFTALSSATITRLEQAWQQVPKKVMRLFELLDNTFSFNKNYLKYRTQIGLHKYPLPYLGIVSKDLFAIEEGNPNFIDGLVNISKLRLIYTQLKPFIQSQKFAALSSKDSTLYAYFSNIDVPSEELKKISQSN